jgi:hypothetical protein
MTATVQVRGFPLALDGRRYAPDTHMWVDMGPERFGWPRSLGVQTNGTWPNSPFVRARSSAASVRTLEAAVRRTVGDPPSHYSRSTTRYWAILFLGSAIPEAGGSSVGLAGRGRAAHSLASPERSPVGSPAKVDEYRLKGVIAE